MEFANVSEEIDELALLQQPQAGIISENKKIKNSLIILL